MRALEFEIGPNGEPEAYSVGERRLKPRFRMFGRAARIDALGDRGLCQIENVSDTGMMVRTPIALTPGDPVRIAFDCRNKLQGRIVWQRGSQAGIRFLRPVESAALIRKVLSDRQDGNVRPPRLSVRRAARATSTSKSFPTIIGNISQGGMCICHAGDLAVGAPIEIALDNGAALRGTVRWSAEVFAGIELCERLPVEQLESVRTWLSLDQDNGQAGGRQAPGYSALGERFTKKCSKWM